MTLDAQDGGLRDRSLVQAQARVSLALDVLEAAALRARQVEATNRHARRRNARGLRTRGQQSLAARILAYQAEAAVAQYLGRPWSSADDWKTVPDVGAWEVRCTEYSTGRLIIKPDDPDGRNYVLVIVRRVGAVPVFDIMGWYNAGDAKHHREWWEVHREHGGAWYVPRLMLNPLRRPTVAPSATQEDGDDE